MFSSFLIGVNTAIVRLKKLKEQIQTIFYVCGQNIKFEISKILTHLNLNLASSNYKKLIIEGKTDSRKQFDFSQTLRYICI